MRSDYPGTSSLRCTDRQGDAIERPRVDERVCSLSPHNRQESPSFVSVHPRSIPHRAYSAPQAARRPASRRLVCERR